MKKLVSILLGTGLLLLLATVAGSVTSQEAQAQLTVGDDFKVAWSLDPRDDAVNFDHTPFHGARSVLVGMDFDSDGKKEILFTTDETLVPGGPDPGVLDVYLYENNGDDNYEHVWHYTHPDSSNSLPALAHGDIDGDGRQEIYLGIPTCGGMVPNPCSPTSEHTDANDLLIFEADDAGVFPSTPTAVYDYGRAATEDFRPAGFHLDDVDNDGKIELVTQSRTGGNRELVVISLVGNSLDAFATFNIEFEVGEAVLGGGGTYDVMVVDFDGDGAKEIWFNTWDNWSMSIFEATGPDTYALQVDLNGLFVGEDPGSFNSHDMYFQNIDGDAGLEAWFPMTDGKLYFVDDMTDVSMLSVADIHVVGTFNPVPRVSRGGDVGDVDGDGQWDIIVANGTSETVSRIEYDGVGDPADSTSYTWSTILSSVGGESDRYYPLRIADDLDGDGMDEIVLTNLFVEDPGTPMIIVLESTGMPVSVEEEADVPETFVLHQNYPNPFNPSTTIRFELPTASAVTVKVYNVMGRLVRTLVSGEMREPGTHSVVWDGRDQTGLKVASGTYIYALEYNRKREARTMVLLK